MNKPILIVDDEPVMALCRGDRDVNEIKLKKAVGGSLVRMMTDDEVFKHTGAAVGFAGPIGVKEGVKIVVDTHLRGRAAMVCGLAVLLSSCAALLP